jgi:hypothetical protein
MIARQGKLLDKPKRLNRGQLMHVCDARNDAIATVELCCNKCGYRSNWIKFGSVKAAKRGLPCPICNKESK